jgi:hypothetical protein
MLLDACYRALMAVPDAVAAYRLVQDSVGRARLDLVPGRAWAETSADRLARGLSQELDGQVEVTVAVVEGLERGPAGKRATILRLVDPPGAAQVPGASTKPA